jgi:membrane-associated phospholipid phosphatase
MRTRQQLGCLLLGYLLVAGAWADTRVGAAEYVGKRLSVWMNEQLSQSPTSDADPLATVFATDAAIPAQTQLRTELVTQLTQSPWDETAAGLQRFLLQSPITGRIAVATTDPAWLRLHRTEDPILRGSDLVVIPSHSHTVAVVSLFQPVCLVTYEAAATNRDYVRRCLPQATPPFVWFVEPDGRYFKVSLGSFAQAKLPEQPLAGAWIWVPAATPVGLNASATTQTHGRLSEKFDEAMARFLATQGAVGAHVFTTNRAADMAAQKGAVPLLSLWQPVADALTSEPLTLTGPVTAVPAREQLPVNDWGEVGILQTPSARMFDAGNVSVTYSQVQPYTRVTFALQPLDFLSFAFRYTSDSEAKYGPEISTQSYKDKSADIKIRLRSETQRLPQVAVGIRDLAGTGLFSSEYLVASKHWGDIDVSAGIGTGYIANRGNLANPLSRLFGDKYNHRSITTQEGGTTGVSYFKGRSALFGGVVWQAPESPWALKAEWDGNNYQHGEPFGIALKQTTPVNLGLSYQATPSYQLSVGLERGNTWMIGVAGTTNYSQINTFKFNNPALPPIPEPTPGAAGSGQATPTEPIEPEWQGLVTEIEKFTDWRVIGIRGSTEQLEISIAPSEAIYRQERLERAMTRIHEWCPPRIKFVSFLFIDRGALLDSVVIERADWVKRQIEPVIDMPLESFHEFATEAQGQAYVLSRLAQTQPTVAVAAAQVAPMRVLWQPTKLPFDVSYGPSYSQIVGGPNHFVQYQLGAEMQTEWRFDESRWLNGDFNYRLADNYRNFVFDGPSVLPRVRTNIRSYVESNRFTIQNLQLNQVFQLSDTQFMSVYAGYLETMFAGVGGEWLYRPLHSSVMFGVDINRVQQRGFDQRFDLLPYKVTEGHAAVYWDTPIQGLRVKLDVGQYLAGDRGGTLDISRRFSNGLILGGYASKTNISAAQFGEGSFDKGVYFKLPLDAILTKDSSTLLDILWQPLLRDGAARLNTKLKLVELTDGRDPKAFKIHSYTPTQPGDHTNDVSYEVPEGFYESPRTLHQLWWDTTNTTAAVGERLFTATPWQNWALGLGTVGVAALLDKPINRWSIQQDNHSVQQWAKLTSDIPVVVGLMSGSIMLLNPPEDPLARTAWDSIQAAGIALAANEVIKAGVGRARPLDGLGAAQFTPFGKTSLGSSFSSNHMVGVMALITPFAEQYDAPWLYGLGAITGFGRVASRNHWFSDVVGGGLIGYAVGNAVASRSIADARTKPKVRITPQSIDVTVAF